MIHNAAAMSCLILADKWLRRYARDEMATVIHEDGTPAKKLIKHTVHALRSAYYLNADGNQEMAEKFGLPLKHIIDTVHFAEKIYARPLQLADLGAFIFGRSVKNQPVPEDVFRVLWKHARWILREPPISDQPASSAPPDALPASLGELPC
jgi:hypothetical protein